MPHGSRHPALDPLVLRLNHKPLAVYIYSGSNGAAGDLQCQILYPVWGCFLVMTQPLCNKRAADAVEGVRPRVLTMSHPTDAAELTSRPHYEL